ncbi:hypothetical protein ACEWY4_027235 [Coilia grayii]|uniref:Ig-like domain-containing protein n=1 Tax=Coilia grayii TaxID=363190 RepID=A0ABD1IU11_9TELE
MEAPASCGFEIRIQCRRAAFEVNRSTHNTDSLLGMGTHLAAYKHNGLFTWKLSRIRGELTCNATHGATCHGALGQPLYLLLSSITRHEFVLKRKNTSNESEEGIFRFKKGKISFYSKHSSLQQRWSFCADNRTLVINPVKMSDAGEYRVQLTNEDTGASVANYLVKLVIKAENNTDLLQHCSAAVTLAILSPVCRGGKRRVQCSASGDGTQLQYSWLVDGVPTTVNLSVDNQVLSLEGEALGNVTCIANNSVSSAKVSVPLWAPCSAAVSSVSLTFICLSQEEKKVVCSSNGDSPWYSWSLDGKPLNETGLVANASDDGHAIILRKHIDGNLTCTATNHISSATKREDQDMELEDRQETVRKEEHTEDL